MAVNFRVVYDELPLDNKQAIKAIVPNAPIMPITINGGAKMSAWYDILSMDDINREVDIDNIQASVNRIEEIIDKQVQEGIDPAKIYLLGFSQGGVIACYTALLSKYPIKKAFLLSTYLPAWDHFKPKVSNIDGLTMHIMHGNQDNVVPIAAGYDLQDKLADIGVSITFSEYTMSHTLCAQELGEIANIINKI